ncbi:MAG: pyridoxamine 5'-phosphate oxidase [Gammaproteobacteria bacterium RIFCSPLOWO2_02_FULL_56_15]|nr:MAG: pyridoxamine 5'-phosphate oxidase [Gammaproteobacteria bacterium RIFCSPLOWO2_02_FULL_56_15]
MNKDISVIRREYLYASLTEAEMSADPVEQFHRWFEEARTAGIDLPNAMSLATAGSDGMPSVRIVLLKDYDSDGFVFYSHADSPKGRQLAENPRASLLFYWPVLDRQVRIAGVVSHVSNTEADEYFQSRPYASRLGAWAAKQSSVITGRKVLDERMGELEVMYGDRPVPRPTEWIGYRVKPETIEFWQGRESRLHDRICYALSGDRAWVMQRLAP